MAPGLVKTGRLTEGQDDGSLETSQSLNLDVSLNNKEDGVVSGAKKQQTKWVPHSQDDFAVLAVRNLVLDICMQNGGGHGGSALGMAAIGVALWKHVMRYNPCDPYWFDRDRFVLSNGCLHLNCVEDGMLIR
jgi:hypothetical protein